MTARALYAPPPERGRLRVRPLVPRADAPIAGNLLLAGIVLACGLAALGSLIVGLPLLAGAAVIAWLRKRK